MKSYEIERKYLVKQVPENLASYPFHEIEQGYSLHGTGGPDPPSGRGILPHLQIQRTYDPRGI